MTVVTILLDVPIIFNKNYSNREVQLISNHTLKSPCSESLPYPRINVNNSAGAAVDKAVWSYSCSGCRYRSFCCNLSPSTLKRFCQCTIAYHLFSDLSTQHKLVLHKLG